VCLAIFLKLKWLILKNECVCEILFPLEKTAAVTATPLQEAFKDEAMGKTQVCVCVCVCGLIISKEVKCLLKTNHVVAALL
jgi:hypothetical protein